MNDPHFDAPAQEPQATDPSQVTDSPPTTDQNMSTDPTASTPGHESTDFDGEQTATYAPPIEQRTQWAPADWPAQTPQHWLEPMPDARPARRRRRRDVSFFVALFVVAFFAAVGGSLLTFLALLATNQIGTPAANVTQPSPSPTLVVAVASGAAQTPAPPPADSTTITDAAQKVSPAVVTITVQTGQPSDPNSGTGVGSGIIFDPNGYVLTNRHVVSDATKVSVRLSDGRQVDGSVYGIDTLTDLAIVKIDATDLPAAPIGDSSVLEPGQTAIVIGSPLGTFTNSVTSGVVSALGRSLVVTDPVTNQQRSLRNLIQTDAAINPGNSGGPLVNSAGEVVGVSTAYAQGAQGIFFAIPINIAKPIMTQASAGEELTRPWIGIVYQAVDQDVARQNNLPVDYGAWIDPNPNSGDSPIVPNSPAEAAGLKAGDIITSIEGHRIDAGAGLDDVLSLFKSGDKLTLDVLRDGQSIEVPITLGTRPANLQ